jgi:hypothetical protein
MRTSGRRIRNGERERAECSYCGAVYDRRDLVREASGLLRCPTEGNGRDVVELTRDSVATAEAWAARKISEPHDPGPLRRDTAEAIGSLTGMILTEYGDPITTEDGIYILQG